MSCEDKDKECQCCVYNFTARRKPVECPKCKFQICSNCFERYTLDNLAIDYIGTICMSCKEPLSFDFITSNTTKTFVSKKYKDKRKEILIGIETSKLPDTQNSANAYKEYKSDIQNITQKIEETKQKLLKKFEILEQTSSSSSLDFPFFKIDTLYDVYQHYNQKSYECSDEKEKIVLKDKCKTLWDLYTSACDLKGEIEILEKELNIFKFNLNRFEVILKQEDDDTVDSNFEKKERKTFIMPCPLNDCKGFMSSGYKCGLCQGKLCSKCHIEVKEKDDKHECDKNLVESVKAINHETRPCPKCGARIYKSEGCFGENTPILLWDGTEKMSQDIVKGDVLVGDDGNARIVQEIMSGVNNMYKVNQLNGISYNVNSKHTLVMKQASILYKYKNSYKITYFDYAEKIFKVKHFVSKTQELNYIDAQKYIRENNIDSIILLTVEDYIKLDKKTQKYLVGYKSNFCTNYPKKDVCLDPYLLGVWLGNGTKSHPVIASNDPEIQQYLNNWCNQNNAELIKESKYKYRIIGKNYSFGNLEVNKDKSNPFTNLLKGYNLVNNKHIPNDYLINDRDTRLKLLAGLVDTDGCVGNYGKHIVITQQDGELSKQIIQLARSLGFAVNYKIVGRNCKDQYKINISGNNLCEIPTIISRKKCKNSNTNKDYFKTNFDVNAVGENKYYGWTLDGNHRFTLPDYTVVHNCDQMWCISCKTAFSWDSGKIVQGERIHNPEYFRWMREHNQEIPRVEDQVGCEDLPPYYAFTEFAYQGIINHQTATSLVNLWRMVMHIIDVEIPQKKNRINRDLRVRYLTNEINMENMRIQLMKRERFNMRNTFIIGMLRLIVDVIRDKLRLCSRHPELALESIFELVSLSKYVNEQMESFTKTHGLITPKFKETENNLFEICKRPRTKKKNDDQTENNNHQNGDYLEDYDYGDHLY